MSSSCGRKGTPGMTCTAAADPRGRGRIALGPRRRAPPDNGKGAAKEQGGAREPRNGRHQRMMTSVSIILMIRR